MPSFEEENCKKCWKVVRNVHKVSAVMYEPHHEKSGFLPMRKQSRDQLCSNCIADQRL